MKSTRTLAVLAALALAPAATAATQPSPIKKDATYKGKTSQGKICRHGTTDGQRCDIGFHTSKDRKSIGAGTIRWSAGPCTDNSSRFYRAATDFTAAISKGKFKVSGEYDAKLDDGTMAHNKVSLNGTFKRSSKGTYSASGQFAVVSDLVLPDGTKSQCKSGPVTWTAKPR